MLRILTKLNENIDIEKYKFGLFIYCGIDEYNDEIFEIYEPIIKCDIFYYTCSNKFNIDIVKPYFESINGSIIFANGNECMIYEYDGEFKKKKHINANLVKRHKKGGQSSVRFSRLAEESRFGYVSNILDNINLIMTKTNWIFGSSEILSMLFERKNEFKINLTNGGFTDFNSETIKNTIFWLKYLKNVVDDNYEKIFKQFVFCLDMNIDRLDFDIKNKNEMEFYIDNSKSDEKNGKRLLLNNDSPYYSRLCIFEYIGIKYFNYDFEE